MPDARWRTGRKVGRTIYIQDGPEPSDDDTLIGVMDDPVLAQLACEAVNTLWEMRRLQKEAGR